MPRTVAKGIRRPRIHIQAQDFGQQRGGALAVAKRIIARAAVAQAEVKIPVGTKRQFAALVVAKRLRDLQQDAFGFQVGGIGIVGGHLEFTDDAAEREVQRLQILAGWILLVVINVKQSVGLETGMERQAQQSALVLKIRMAVGDVEKGFRVAAVGTLFDHDDASRLIHDEQPARIVRRFGHPYGAFALQLGQHRLEPDWRQRRRAGEQRRGAAAQHQPWNQRPHVLCNAAMADGSKANVWAAAKFSRHVFNRNSEVEIFAVAVTDLPTDNLADVRLLTTGTRLRPGQARSGPQSALSSAGNSVRLAATNN